MKNDRYRHEIKYLCNENTACYLSNVLATVRTSYNVELYKSNYPSYMGTYDENILRKSIVDALIKDHDVVIHLAGVLPPLANVRDDLIGLGRN